MAVVEMEIPEVAFCRCELPPNMTATWAKELFTTDRYLLQIGNDIKNSYL